MILAAIILAASGPWLLTARILYARWNGRLRRRRASPAEVAAYAMAAALAYPLLAIAALVRWRQPETFTERYEAIKREQEILEAERKRLDKARAAMLESQAAWIEAAEAELEIGDKRDR